MPPEDHGPPTDPRQWLRHAASDLALARAEVPGVEDQEPYCFHAQQAAEKAIKAMLLSRGIRFPFVHDLDRLIALAEDHGVDVPADVREADALTDYAVLTRYHSSGNPWMRSSGKKQSALPTGWSVGPAASSIRVELAEE